MAWNSLLFIAALGIGVAASAQSPLILKSEAGPVDGTSQTEDLSFKDDGHQRMTVAVRLSGQGPFRFMVDTGADRTAISRQLAERLKLTGRSSASLHSVTGVSKVETALVPELQLTRRSVRVIDAPLLDSAHIGADGILGVDSLRSQRIHFDFEQNLMSIVPSAKVDEPYDPEAIVISASRRNGRLIFTDARVDGRQVTVILDTGSEVSIGNRALRELLVGRRSDPSTEKVELHSVTGDTLTGDYRFVRELDMGGVSLKRLAVVFADAHTFKKLGLNDRPALLLGMNAMRAFKRVSIDFANRKFRVVVPESSSLESRIAGKMPQPGARTGL